MGTMEETMADMDNWELRKAIRLSLEEDSDEEDLPIRTTYTPHLSYTSVFDDNRKPVVATDLEIEPEISERSSSDDSVIDQEPNEIPLDELEMLVRGLDMASITFSDYTKLSPLHFWLQGFGRGNPVHDHFRNMHINSLHNYASNRKIHAALQVLQSDSNEADKRQRAVVAVQKYHADDMIEKMLNALRDATPEEYTIYEPEDYRSALRRIHQWLKWQNRAVRLEGLPSGGPQCQEPLKLEKMIHDRFDKKDPSTFRHRYELHANEPQSTPTHGDLVWFPGGSVTYPVQPLWYSFYKRGIPVRLPVTTRVWDPAEDCIKLTRRMPDYPMLHTPEKDGDGQLYLDQSRHRRGAVAAPKPTPQVPTFDPTLHTWTKGDRLASTSPEEVLQPPGIAAPSTHPASFQEESVKMRHVGPPCGSLPHRQVHDGWGLPLGGLNKRKLGQMDVELPQDPKQTKQGNKSSRPQSLNVIPEADPIDPEWRHPSPKSGPCAPRPVAISLADHKAAKFNALLKMHLWRWPTMSPHVSRSRSSDHEDIEEEDEPDDKDDVAYGRDEEDKVMNSSAQPQNTTSHSEKDTLEISGNSPCEDCLDPTTLPHDSRPDHDADADAPKEPGNRQKHGPLLTQLRLSGGSRTLRLRGGGNTGGLFGATNGSSAPATTQTGGGLFGSNTATSSAPATGTSVFNGGVASSQAPAATNAASSSLFGGGGLNLGASKPAAGTGLFGSNTTTTQPPAASTGGGMFGGGANTTNQQANVGSGLFGNSTQNPQGQQTVPAVRIDASNIKPTTRFSELHEDIQQQILAIDEIIQASIEKSLQCSQVIPQLGASVEALPGDVELLETRLETVDGALSRDAQAVGASKEVINADALEALKVFRAVENLKLPAQFHYSSIGGGFNSGSGAGEEEGSTDLLPYFNSTANKLEKEVNEYQRVVVEVESHLRTVEGSAVEGIQKVVRRRQMMGASNGQNGTNGQADMRKEGLRELAETMRGFEEAVLRVAGRVGEAREGVVELGMGISRR
ncbi:hypothetical protein BLS_003087 [Venturia inaequalis]|uniref:Uncharacterized protein n=2 Tax=Venturia inaequalis TaxID=5025 RepID=A0A8H3UPS6_VENIN|nr:hypothetical protein BLS_003087 [Venturia inaequalis]KAE9981736.1 hypothetical protein EG328_011434 [Venturia inaequalis]